MADRRRADLRRRRGARSPASWSRSAGQRGRGRAGAARARSRWRAPPARATTRRPTGLPPWWAGSHRRGRGAGALADPLVPAREPRRGQRAHPRLHARERARRRPRCLDPCATPCSTWRGRARAPTQLAVLLRRAELRLVLTAHPTEARRRTTLEKLARVFAVLRELDERPGLPGAVARARGRPRRPCRSCGARTSCAPCRPPSSTRCAVGSSSSSRRSPTRCPPSTATSRAAVAEAYPDEAPIVPPLLTFGSWIGGDRDGNPHVTPAMTLEALRLMRDQCLRFLEERIGILAQRVSLSQRIAGPAEGLAGCSQRAPSASPSSPRSCTSSTPRSPTGGRSFLRERVRATRDHAAEGYGAPAELLADLRQAERSLCERGGGLTAAGDLRDVIRQVEVFGFHFARSTSASTPAPSAGARRDPRRPREAAASWGSPRASARAAVAGDRRPAAGDPRRPERLLRGDARGGRDVPDPRSALTGEHRGASRPTSSRAPRARPTSSRCCCS